MATPVTVVASGGLPVAEMVFGGGIAVTEIATNGLAVTKVAAGRPGLGVTFVSVTGAPVLTPTKWNSADKSASINLTNNDLTATATAIGGVRSTPGRSTGKIYYEVTMATWASTSTQVGIAMASAAFSTANTLNRATINQSTGTIAVHGAASGFTLGPRASGDVIGLAVNLNTKLLWARVAPAGSWNGNATHDPETGAGGVSISVIVNAGALFPFFCGTTASESAIANFGASSFVGAVPAGFTAGWPA